MGKQNVSIDYMGGGHAQGRVAKAIATSGGMSPSEFRPYLDKKGRPTVVAHSGGDRLDKKNWMKVYSDKAVLRKDEWKMFDDAVHQVAEKRLNGIEDLEQAGLVHNIGDGMSFTVMEWEDMGDALEAEISMDGVTRAQNSRIEFGMNYLPLPIIHADYELNLRFLKNSRNRGQALDTTMAERAARRVNEKLEELLFTDKEYSFKNGKIYSYLSHPDVNTVVLDNNWDDTAACSPEDIKNDVLAMKQASINKHFFGPWKLYVPTNYETRLDDDYFSGEATGGGRGRTIRQRILDIEGITGVKVIDTLPANTVCLVQMTSDVVRLVRGMGIQNAQWEREGGFIQQYKVMTIQVPQVRSDQNGNTGIVILS